MRMREGVGGQEGEGRRCWDVGAASCCVKCVGVRETGSKLYCKNKRKRIIPWEGVS